MKYLGMFLQEPIAKLMYFKVITIDGVRCITDPIYF